MTELPWNVRSDDNLDIAEPRAGCWTRTTTASRT